MYSVYVLRSTSNGKRYIGQTSKDAAQRLQEHNEGSNKWTSQNGPFTTVWVEQFNTRTEAIIRENFLKSGQGRKWLDDNIPR